MININKISLMGNKCKIVETHGDNKLINNDYLYYINNNITDGYVQCDTVFWYYNCLLIANNNKCSIYCINNDYLKLIKQIKYVSKSGIPDIIICIDKLAYIINKKEINVNHTHYIVDEIKLHNKDIFKIKKNGNKLFTGVIFNYATNYYLKDRNMIYNIITNRYAWIGRNEIWMYRGIRNGQNYIFDSKLNVVKKSDKTMDLCDFTIMNGDKTQEQYAVIVESLLGRWNIYNIKGKLMLKIPKGQYMEDKLPVLIYYSRLKEVRAMLSSNNAYINYKIEYDLDKLRQKLAGE